MPDAITKSKELADEIKSKINSGEPVRTKLATNERVIARVTDGIYRQPAASLRELISNAYDADATKVVIHTDAPRFRRITIRDDGAGMTEEALAFLIKNIGGSAKRTPDGYEVGVTDKKNSLLSPEGRKLIGRIGIGLFSVSQLSRHFKIITKVKGKKYRNVAEVILKTYSEDELREKTKGKEKKFETGNVTIYTRKADDIDSHGTEIIIMDLKPGAEGELRSAEIWGAADYDNIDDIHEPVKFPKYHIGRMEPKNKDIIKIEPSLPWDREDNPEVRFNKLRECIEIQFEQSEGNPKLRDMFDNYLRMIWSLSLSAPIDYIEKHPFDLIPGKDIRVFELGNEKKSQAKELDSNKKVRDIFGLVCPERGGSKKFEVFIDGIKLMRPIRMWNKITTSHSIKEPLLFVGKYKPDISNVPKDIRGGNLSFEAYFRWTPVVVPEEHRGIMIRVSDVSSAFFDPTFMQYPISEQTRLRQITAEIFVREGLDPAMNIDRESFNHSHLHYQVLMKWVHNTLRQIANKHKHIGAKIREEKISAEAKEMADDFDRFVEKEISDIGGEEEKPEVILTDEPEKDIEKRHLGGALVFNKKKILSGKKLKARSGSRAKLDAENFERKTRALIKLLDAFGVFENMPYKKQEDLVRRIVNIFGYSFERLKK
jgi:hypothetical protein